MLGRAGERSPPCAKRVVSTHPRTPSTEPGAVFRCVLRTTRAETSATRLQSGSVDYISGPVSDENENLEATEAAAPEQGAAESAEGNSGDAEVAAAEAPVDPLEQAQAEAKRLKEQLLRTAADFDNFRKRTRKELVDAEQRGTDQLLKEMLPVFDNLERAAQHAETASEVASLADGIRMVMKQFTDTLGRLNIERVEAVGKPFDPSVHEAIQQMATEEHPPGSVAAEVQAGYRQGERLIRPALVVVAKAP
ncbi:MAG: nucleotide exchange factor GrpE [Polyangiaceae bacterium]|nr:nucleotide exchange factor GrpE [Myxococcales bacterium]MCB9590588.1 nucleotide exchange factor GrpE [Polyangiaceae bacterium]